MAKNLGAKKQLVGRVGKKEKEKEKRSGGKRAFFGSFVSVLGNLEKEKEKKFCSWV